MLGIGADTGAFAVNGIRNWWLDGTGTLPKRNLLSIALRVTVAWCNGQAQSRLKKMFRSEFATETFEINVSALLPARTSKWNKIEHRAVQPYQ